MITIEEFIVKIENEFDEIGTGTVKPELAVEEAIEMSSLNMLLVMAFIKTEFDLTLAAKRISECSTFEELYNLIDESLKS